MTIESAYLYPSDLNSSLPAAGDVKSEGDDHIRGIKSVIKTTFPNVSGAVTPTHTELNYVDGVTSAIQTQIDAKAPSAGPTFTGTVTLPSTTSIGNASATEIGYLDGVTSAIQTQIDAKAPTASPTFTGTPAAPTAAAATNTTQIATTAFVATAITAAGISGGLPSQTGNSGKALITDGTSVSWGVPVTGTSITSAVSISNTETVIHSYVASANELAAGTTLRFTAIASPQTGSNSASPTIRIRVGTTTLTGNIAATLTGIAGNTGPTLDNLIEGEVTVRSAGGSGSILGWLGHSKSGTTLRSAATSTVAVDTTAASMRIELTFDSGSASNTYPFQLATVQKIAR